MLAISCATKYRPILWFIEQKFYKQLRCNQVSKRVCVAVSRTFHKAPDRLAVVNPAS